MIATELVHSVTFVLILIEYGVCLTSLGEGLKVYERSPGANFLSKALLHTTKDIWRVI